MATFKGGFMVREKATLTEGERVEVYYNLLQGGFSIKSIDKRNPHNGKVVAYSDFVFVENATFHWSLKKLAQIQAKHCKTVYAVVKGTYLHHHTIDNAAHRKGYCNPYVTGKFIDWETKAELKSAEVVYFYDKFFSYTPLKG